MAMMESFLITSRETLEASLVVGIVLGYLGRTEQQKYNKVVYYGIGAGLILSIISAFLFTIFAGGFEGRAEELFEGTTMLIASFLLTTMILWMLRQQHIAKEIESKVASHLAKAQVSSWGTWGLFFLILFAILREGVETVIFFGAISYTSGINWLGGILGIGVAVAIGYLFFIGTRKVNLRKFFTISSILLILFAAGLAAHGIHEFEEAGVVPGIISPVWDTNGIINEDSTFGGFLEGLFGYNGNPSLVEVLAYLVYLLLIFGAYWRIEHAKRALQKA
jgi:high-affinity iron transporter